ncbi:SAM-dependent methyltransferase [Frankia sp. AgPm24]|uniref:SAM-dependent methyltransferase n=1 Tax=Frankia sp. AgPm24 TaxID=631128 RepID=UPI00200E64DF|nr:SAM-dependent methyltransferase [Frankia sp. AgPm24]MCK9921991.1 SAM-dependent methyltransferase [Frankia sp. AgPm24]
MAWTRHAWQATPRPPVNLHTDQPHSARMYDYLLGGKDNFPPDRDAAEQALAGFPYLRIATRQNRAFMTRAVRYLAAEAGIRQFLDIGTGIPTSPNLHETVQAVAPDARVVYADNDPIVLTHARALLTGTAAGRTACLDADLRDVESILAAPELRDTLDLTRPVSLSLIAILHFVPDSDDPYRLVARLVDALPAGSHLTISHGTGDFAPAVRDQAASAYRARGVSAAPRDHAAFVRFFDGLELLDPGVTVAHRWRPDDQVPAGLTDAQVSCYVAVARKP